MKKSILAAIAVMLLLVGCSSNSTSGPATASGSGQGPTLKVGMELAYPPFETKDDNGNPSGVSVDLAKALGAYLNRPVEIENTAWDGLIPSLQSGKVDVVVSSMTITAERSKVVTFSNGYAKAYLAFLMNKNSTATSVEALNSSDHTIAVKKGTTGETWVRENLPKANVTALSSENAAVTEVLQNKADAFIYDQLTIYRQQVANPDTTTMMAIPDQNPQEWGMAVKLGNTELVDQINAFLVKYTADGGFNELTSKYLAKEKQVFDKQGFPWFFSS